LAHLLRGHLSGLDVPALDRALKASGQRKRPPLWEEVAPDGGERLIGAAHVAEDPFALVVVGHRASLSHQPIRKLGRVPIDVIEDVRAPENDLLFNPPRVVALLKRRQDILCARSARENAPVKAFLDEYVKRYAEGDVRGVTNLCHVPFLAVRRGEVIHMPDDGAVWDHFASAIGAYRRAAGVEQWKRLETDTRQLGEHSVFASVHWNALNANGQVVRDTWTSYQLLATPEGWRLLSYTNHF
jgi:hypothetical protein